VVGAVLFPQAARFAKNPKMLDIALSARARENQPNTLVRICIVGSNQTLADACRLHVQQLCQAGYYIQECGSANASLGCDIYIWNFESSPYPPTAMVTAEDASKVVVAKKSSLSSVRRELQGTDFTYLQTPVTPLSLRTVLASAIARPQLRDDDGIRSSRLKLDRDQIWASSRTQGASFSSVLPLARSFNHSHHPQLSI
jgi:hypothetical protein